MGNRDVGEQLDAAIDDVIRLERELAHVTGERDRARALAVLLEQDADKVVRDVAETTARRRSVEAYIKLTESRVTVFDWQPAAVLEVLDDIVQLLDGKIL